jgi:hypothetical protein
MNEKMIPYSVYLPEEYYDKIKELAKQRLASSMVRDAICMIIDGKDEYQSGYSKGIKDAIKVVKKSKDLQDISIKGCKLNELIMRQIAELDI